MHPPFKNGNGWARSLHLTSLGSKEVPVEVFDVSVPPLPHMPPRRFAITSSRARAVGSQFVLACHAAVVADFKVLFLLLGGVV